MENNVVTPVRVDKFNHPPHKVVEWKLGNTCNYDCSFCSNNNKDGSERWLPLEVYTRVCTGLAEQARTEGKAIVFQFTGGEPTLFPGLIELLKTVKALGCYANIITNGSRTLRWWRELADQDLLSRIFFTAHVEQGARVDHLVEVVELFKDKPVHVHVQCTAPPHLYSAARLLMEQLIERAVCTVSIKKINAEGDIGYTSEQLTDVAENSYLETKRFGLKTPGKTRYAGSMQVTFSDGSKRVALAHSLIANGITNFFGWNCAIGIDYLNIVYDTVYRGQCRQGGSLGSVFDPVHFQKDQVRCLRNRCDCATDYHEPKKAVI